jgi:hypothetical protein
VLLLWLLFTWATLVIAVIIGWHFDWNDDYVILTFAILWFIFSLTYIRGVISEHDIVHGFIHWVHGALEAAYKAHFAPTVSMPLSSTGEIVTVDTKQALMDYVASLYEQDANGKYINIYDDGKIIGSVPWSKRAGELDRDITERYFEIIGVGKRIIELRAGGWYLNIETYPSRDSTIKLFKNVYIYEKEQKTWR